MAILQLGLSLLMVAFKPSLTHIGLSADKFSHTNLYLEKNDAERAISTSVSNAAQ